MQLVLRNLPVEFGCLDVAKRLQACDSFGQAVLRGKPICRSQSYRQPLVSLRLLRRDLKLRRRQIGTNGINGTKYIEYFGERCPDVSDVLAGRSQRDVANFHGGRVEQRSRGQQTVVELFELSQLTAN